MNVAGIVQLDYMEREKIERKIELKRQQSDVQSIQNIRCHKKSAELLLSNAYTWVQIAYEREINIGFGGQK